jgi:phenylalanyl-tRNA synthetase beta chain
MNVSVSWLNEFAETKRSTNELRDLLTAHTATVEEVIALRADLAPIVVARVVQEAAHPDSDHLHITKVDMGTGELLDVVCGAPNVTAGKMYPFAPTGTIMPGGLKIEKRKIRGQTSNGMLCSARELGLGEEHDGIMELDLDVAPGTPFLAAMPVGDARLVVDVLPNRPDLLSHLGVAREIAAVTGGEVRLPDIGTTDIEIPEARRFRRAGNAGDVVLHLEDATLASRYMGIVIRGVKVGPSPQWLVDRLVAVGSRSINNIVDATNYVLHELGQPTHAFDLLKVDPEPKMPERTIVVRSARAGETLVTLDGATRKLTPEMTVIADSRDPIALAGVMGGAGTEVSEETTEVFIEVATFDPARTRKTRRAVGLSTDASHRFERGVDVALAPRALARVASLVIALAGGEVLAPPVDLYAGESARVPVVLRTSRVSRVLGVALPVARIAQLLKAIGCTADIDDAGAAVHVIAPTWRRDLLAEADLIEEVARLHGYDALPNELRPYRPGTTSDAPLWTLAARLRDFLSGAGLFEARPLPFVWGDESHVAVINPLSEDEGHLRRRVLQSLAKRVDYNLSQMQGNVRLYEIGTVFEPVQGHHLPRESWSVAAIIMGDREPLHFRRSVADKFEEWDIKYLAERSAKVAYPSSVVELVTEDGKYLRWTILVDGEKRGFVVKLYHEPRLVAASASPGFQHINMPVWAADAFAFELELAVMSNADVAPPGEHAHSNAVAAAPPAPTKYRPLPTTPAAEFDLALLLPSGVRAAQVEDVIRGAAGELLERLAAFDLYDGAGIEAGTRSVAWRLTLRHPERTLRDKEIEGRRSKILSALQTELNVRPRST